MNTSQLHQERTDWRSGLGTSMPTIHQVTGGDSLRDATNLWTTRLIMAPLPSILGFGGTGTLFNNAMVTTPIREATAAPAIRWPVTFGGSPIHQVIAQTEAQRLGDQLRRVSGLTNEEIAPLLSVSRRSFQSWLAGDPISARKEARLRAVTDALIQLAAATPLQTRARLLGRDRDRHSVSAYDLLREGRFDAAVDLALERRRGILRPRSLVQESLAEQFDRDQSSIPQQPVRLNRRLSKPLRR